MKISNAMRNTRQWLFIHFLFRVAFYSFLTFKDIPVSLEFPALVLIFDFHLYYVANSVAQLENEDLCANKYYTVYSKPGCIFFSWGLSQFNKVEKIT